VDTTASSSNLSAVAGGGGRDEDFPPLPALPPEAADFFSTSVVVDDEEDDDVDGACRRFAEPGAVPDQGNGATPTPPSSVEIPSTRAVVIKNPPSSPVLLLPPPKSSLPSSPWSSSTWPSRRLAPVRRYRSRIWLFPRAAWHAYLMSAHTLVAPIAHFFH